MAVLVVVFGLNYYCYLLMLMMLMMMLMMMTLLCDLIDDVF